MAEEGDGYEVKRCRKRVFRDDVAAKLAIATIARKDNTSRDRREVRSYKCPNGRHYHITSMSEWEGHE